MIEWFGRINFVDEIMVWQDIEEIGCEIQCYYCLIFQLQVDGSYWIEGVVFD